MTVHYGVIGCGMMGREHLANIALMQDAAASVIFEPDPEMAAAAAAAAPGATLVDSVEALLAHDRLDCLLIASPNHCHTGQLQMIANAVSLPILVEKPLFTDPADLAAIRAFRDSYAAPVWVAMEYRYMPPMQHFLEQVGAATGGIRMLSIVEHRYPFLGKVGNWNRFNANSGGTYVEKCCHFFDLMRLILGADPVRIMASGGQEVNHRDERYDGAAPDIWDCGYVIIDFANGACHWAGRQAGSQNPRSGEVLVRARGPAPGPAYRRKPAPSLCPGDNRGAGGCHHPCRRRP
jgi:myo-inositol 2-dehydrogenase/D-chiro-inositol 1-dehydrogenase